MQQTSLVISQKLDLRQAKEYKYAMLLSDWQILFLVG